MLAVGAAYWYSVARQLLRAWQVRSEVGVMATDSNCALWQAVPAQQCLSLVAVASTQTYLLLLQTLLVAHTVFVVAVEAAN